MPRLPSWRAILVFLIGFLVMFGILLAYMVQAASLVSQLRDRGVTTLGVVKSVDNKPKYLEVEYRTDSGKELVRLKEIAGMLPEAAPGDSLLITYDPQHPATALSRAWVEEPPYLSLPILGTALVAAFFLVGGGFLAVRRRQLLRSSAPSAPTSRALPTAGVRLRK